MNVLVLTVDTNEEKCAERIRWEKSLLKIDLNFRVLDKEKWGGWKWRCERILKELVTLELENKYKYIIICDCWDLIFQRAPGNLDVEELKNAIILGAEKQRTGVKKFNRKYKEPWENINGGFIIGDISNLIQYYRCILDKWSTYKVKFFNYFNEIDDQHMMSAVFSENKLPFHLKLDTNSSYVLNFTRDVKENEFLIENNVIYSLRDNTKKIPICIHNPGNPEMPIQNLTAILNKIVFEGNK